jgi:hypothetical protein
MYRCRPGPWVNVPGSERPLVSRVFPETPALVEIRLAPDPRLVGAAHFWFDHMDPAEVPLFCNTAQEGADRNIFTGVGMAHLERNNAAEIFRFEDSTVYRCAFFHERDKPPEDISPPLFHPDIHIRYSRSNNGAENPAAESALLTGVIFRCQVIHGILIHYSSGVGIMFFEISPGTCYCQAKSLDHTGKNPLRPQVMPGSSGNFYGDTSI